MDGTLVDTEPYWMAEEHAIVAAHGGVWTQADALHLVGSDLISAASYLKACGNIELSPEEIVQQLLAGVIDRMRRHVPWRPGARELLAQVRAADIPCGLVTMSWAPLAELLLEQLPGAFQAVVTGDAVKRPKPHPEPYLLAAEQLGVQPGDCVAIEDSPTGLASAVAAGTQALAVPHVLPIANDPAYSRVPSLVGITLADLTEVARGHRIQR
jgi:HAD superfamily hydrolase (TIGR01509 family)